MQQWTLATGWELKERDPERPLDADFTTESDWLPASSPGTVHQDLLAAGRIPDPFIGLNENDVQWIGERDWLYHCRFDLPPDVAEPQTIALCCDGLDTFATVWLNGARILVSDNMFVPQRVNVASLLQPGRNELRILFESALRIGKQREAEYGQMRVWNGDPSRVYVRKAQYHYGWDWGPCLMTAGPWRDIRIESYDARIADVHCPAEVAADLRSARLPIVVEIESATVVSGDLAVHLAVVDPDDQIVAEARVPVSDSRIEHSFMIDAPQLWWPRGYGAQDRYRIVASLQQAATELDRQERRIGLRRLRLVQEPLHDEPGTTFLFEINNTPIFCGGANWIPADSFLPRITPERYREQLQLAADANMVMLRVWGGGIYEDDVFYDLCDELGLLVWQDFMFACGMYPAYPAFQASVRAEADAAIRRLRHHPSIALWCGNNEDYQIAESLNAYDSRFTGDFTTTAFPAREIYERRLPDICARLDPTRPYWPGSAYGGETVTDQTVGDRHTWDVWHGQMANYHDYPRYEGRFVSEFGMQALPAPATIASFAPPAERYAESRTLEHHNKAEGGLRRIAVYLSDTLRTPNDFPSYIYATQFVQAEALAAAYRGWRRRWAGPGHYAVAGALVWQLNDCWPVTSWAIIDDALRPKPAYYVIKRDLAPLAVGLDRSTDGVAAWVVNGTTEQRSGELEIRVWSLDGERRAAEQQSVTLVPNQTTELGALRLDAGAEAVIGARLIVDGAVVARAVSWPEPFKYLTLPDPEIAVTRLDDERLQITAKRPAKGVWLEAGDDVRWSDNMLDLLPDDEQIVVARGLGTATLQVRSLQGLHES